MEKPYLVLLWKNLRSCYTNIIIGNTNMYKIRIHDFRHSYTFLLIYNVATFNMFSKFLGHTKIEETLNTYTHLFNSALNEVVNLIDNIE